MDSYLLIPDSATNDTVTTRVHYNRSGNARSPYHMSAATGKEDVDYAAGLQAIMSTPRVERRNTADDASLPVK